ncbi:hypothetical protein AVHY2522_09240 [Acidovorax sp. SUPP2522]|uniref:hypothetical protein n=1 Tax=unclassified Acidovorax TaxID=2684926 RepID=UPI002349E6E7|nr:MULTISPECIES: hypothetical protein [unclassified Acidovorax]WCM95818.1 hypothetical protein M5C96_15220 [Acidovorax sp. GBBC 1281]GKT15757.1 hypothetical protein AVHY2522_09240 [Acidovorax sp. SUPP2522]
MSTQYINIASDALKALFKNKITEYDRKVYFTICHHATFKHQVFGIYERKSFHTLRNLVKALTGDDKQIVHLQRSIARLESAGLLKVLFQSCEMESPPKGIKPPPKELIISLDPSATLQSLCNAIEQNIEDFNIYADRIRELEKNIGVKLNIVKKTASKMVAITNAELDDDEKIAGELFPGQLQVVPETDLISLTMESASAGFKYFPRRTSVP